MTKPETTAVDSASAGPSEPTGDPGTGADPVGGAVGATRPDGPWRPGNAEPAPAYEPEPDDPDRSRRPRALTVVTLAALALFALYGIGSPLLGLSVFAGTDELVTRVPYVNAGFAGTQVQNNYLDDTWDGAIPNLLLFADGVRHGEFAQWNPYMVGGVPLAATPGYAVANPISLPFYLLPGWLAPGYAKLLEILVAAGGCFLYLRRIKLGRPAAVTGGLVFAASAFLITWTNWPQTKVAAFIPAVFWAIERLVQQRRPRDAVLLCLSLAAMILGGFPAIVGYTLTIAVPYLLVRVFAEYTGDWRRRIGLILAGGAAAIGAVCLAAVQLLPFVEFLSNSLIRGRQQAPSDNLSLSSLVTAIAPYALGGVNPNRTPYWYLSINFVESLSYLGAAALVLVLTATVMARAGRSALPRGVWLFLIAMTGAAVLVIYVGGPPLALLQKLPVLFSDNFIGRARSVLGFLLATLAAVGLELLLSGRRSTATGRARQLGRGYAVAVWLVAALVGGLAWRNARREAYAANAARHDGVDRVQHLNVQMLIGFGLVALALVCVVVLYRSHPSATGRHDRGALADGPFGRRTGLVRFGAAALLPLLIAVQALSLVRPYWPRADRDTFYPVTDVQMYLAGHLGHERFAGTWGTMPFGADLPRRMRALTGHSFEDERFGTMVRAVPGAQGLYPTYLDFSATPEAATSPVLDRLGTRFFVTSPGAMFGTPHPAQTDGSVTTIQPDDPVVVPLAGGPLRGIGITAVEPLPPVTATARLELSLRDGSGTVVATESRLLKDLAAGPFTIPLAAEQVPAGTATSATLTLHATGPLRVAGRSGVPALDTITDPGDGLRLVYAGSAVVWQRLNALPRVRWASTSVVEPDADKRTALVAGGSLRDDQVVLDAPAARADGRPAQVRITEDGFDAIEATVAAEGAGYLVVSDALQHGWSATVDGRSTPLLAADQGVVTVAVPAGEHTVRLHYTAPYHNAGGWLSGLTALVLLGLVGGEWWWRRSRRQTSRRSPGADPTDTFRGGRTASEPTG